ncbi:MAG: transcriptional activator NhaR [Rhodocyclales bacterium GT-UBC]|nr:MAG: transcriptional activator NhaR [Rhodocyclales bacterium GT-UBC]
MNHKHLFYFWKAAKAGSIAKAADAIAITPQTLSGQIGLLEKNLGTELFAKQGRSLVLTEAGKLALDYADELFALSAELEAVIKHHPKGRPAEFRVGVSDAVPKSLAYQLLQPAIGGEQPTRIICREWQLDRLLGQLAVHQLDLVISDSPIPPSYSVRAYNHHLLSSGLSFLAAPGLMTSPPATFPDCLNTLPVMLPGEDSAIRSSLEPWFERKGIRPRILGEFDDTALMAAFGRAGTGLFPVPSIAEDEFVASGELAVVGRTREVTANYYAISVERRLTHPCVVAITRSAHRLTEARSETEAAIQLVD